MGQRRLIPDVCQSPRRTVRLSKMIPRASIEQEVSQKLKEAMKKKDAAALKALRGIRAAFLTASKQEGAGDSLPDKVAIEQLRKLAKMRKESIEMFRKGGRDDMADDEKAELEVIEQWLPTLASREQTVLWAKDAMLKVGAAKPGDIGKVMGVIMREHRQEVDGTMAKEVVQELLTP
ncbi:Aspartyl/glutamyl-tRNA(Asn/Gln) amidotransferase subunit B [Gracilaria domingensis]|nr:Aspartyl/glutamyl-tRNA(Asn/Gln) amidotransferase subunit B [Gracilaria domingensis]